MISPARRTVVLLAAAAVALLSSSSQSSGALALSTPPNVKFNRGAGVGRLVIDEKAGKEDAWACHYDMVLVERIQGKPQKESGLFIPEEDLPRLHLCTVLSLGPGKEEENGFVTDMPNVAVGDTVLAKNPWGIGPKDEETADGRKLSFMRSQDIAAIITGGIVPEE